MIKLWMEAGQRAQQHPTNFCDEEAADNKKTETLQASNDSAEQCVAKVHGDSAIPPHAMSVEEAARWIEGGENAESDRCGSQQGDPLVLPPMSGEYLRVSEYWLLRGCHLS
jgi:hypothetical protein